VAIIVNREGNTVILSPSDVKIVEDALNKVEGE